MAGLSVRRFLSELRRRKVTRAAVLYSAVGWVLIEVASVVVPALHLPEWASTLVVVLVALGFPIALVLSWTFDLTAALEVPAEGEAPPAIKPARGIGWLPVLSIAALGVIIVWAVGLLPARVQPAATPAYAWRPTGSRPTAGS